MDVIIVYIDQCFPLQCVNSGTPHAWVTEEAPEPRDVIWDNLEMGFWKKLIRSVTSSLANNNIIVIPLSMQAVASLCRCVLSCVLLHGADISWPVARQS